MRRGTISSLLSSMSLHSNSYEKLTTENLERHTRLVAVRGINGAIGRQSSFSARTLSIVVKKIMNQKKRAKLERALLRDIENTLSSETSSEDQISKDESTSQFTDLLYSSQRPRIIYPEDTTVATHVPDYELGNGFDVRLDRDEEISVNENPTCLLDAKNLTTSLRNLESNYNPLRQRKLSNRLPSKQSAEDGHSDSVPKVTSLTTLMSYINSALSNAGDCVSSAIMGSIVILFMSHFLFVLSLNCVIGSEFSIFYHLNTRSSLTDIVKRISIETILHIFLSIVMEVAILLRYSDISEGVPEFIIAHIVLFVLESFVSHIMALFE